MSSCSARDHFPAKEIKYVSNSIRPTSLSGFLDTLPLVFQKTQAKDLEATYHFTFTGKEPLQGTVAISRGNLLVDEGLNGDADLAIVADSEVWLSFLKGEQHLFKALLLRKIRLKGNIKLMKSFANCFNS